MKKLLLPTALFIALLSTGTVMAQTHQENKPTSPETKQNLQKPSENKPAARGTQTEPAPARKVNTNDNSNQGPAAQPASKIKPAENTEPAQKPSEAKPAPAPAPARNAEKAPSKQDGVKEKKTDSPHQHN